MLPFFVFAEELKRSLAPCFDEIGEGRAVGKESGVLGRRRAAAEIVVCPVVGSWLDRAIEPEGSDDRLSR